MFNCANHYPAVHDNIEFQNNNGHAVATRFSVVSQESIHANGQRPRQSFAFIVHSVAGLEPPAVEAYMTGVYSVDRPTDREILKHGVAVR